MSYEKACEEMKALRDTLRTLRGENGCPWDRERTPGQLISYLVDEVYELLNAEASGDVDNIEEELGDVFFLIIFIHDLLDESARMPLSRTIARVHKKIIDRHPHVFGDTNAATHTESVAEWERIKSLEKPQPDDGLILSSVDSKTPPLRQAMAISKKVVSVGFEWPDHEGVLEKLDEEIGELREAVISGDRDNIREEVGDILFTAVNLARILDIDPDNSLARACSKFRDRFNLMETKIRKIGRKPEDLTLDELESFWQDSK
jgi:tetrapyrrole methylase family protein/MazG family protein